MRRSTFNNEVIMNQISNSSQPTEQELALYQTLIKRQNTKRFNQSQSKSGLVLASLVVIALSIFVVSCSYSTSIIS